MIRHIERPRRLVGAATLLIAALALGACGPSATPSTPGQGSTGAAPTASSAGAGAVGSGAPSAVTDRLAAAFATMADGYTYTATITVGTATVSTAKGRSVGGSSEFVLTSGGKSVSYRAIPPKAWVQQAGGAWVVVSGKVPSGSPIAGLTSPTTAAVVSDAADGLVVDASYPPAALGLKGDKPVRVRLTMAGNGSVTATFQTAVGTDPAASTSVFAPAPGLAPITAPSS